MELGHFIGRTDVGKITNLHTVYDSQEYPRDLFGAVGQASTGGIWQPARTNG